MISQKVFTVAANYKGGVVQTIRGLSMPYGFPIVYSFDISKERHSLATVEACKHKDL